MAIATAEMSVGPVSLLAARPDGITRPPRGSERSAYSVVLVACAVGVATVLEWHWPGTHALALAVVAAVTGGQVISLRWATGRPVPLAAIPVCMLNVTGSLGFFFYPVLDTSALVSARVSDDGSIYRAAALTFAVASASIWVGALAFSRIALNTRAPASRATGEPVGVKVTVAAVLLQMSMVVAGIGPGNLLERASHLDTSGPRILVSAGVLSLPAGVLASSLLIFHPSRGAARRLGLVFLVLYALLYFSAGSRGFCLTPPMVVLGALLSGRQIRWKPLVLAAVAAGFLVQLPLALRSDSDGVERPAGLIPYGNRVLHNPVEMFVPDIEAPIGNVLFAVPLTGAVAAGGGVSPESFAVSINPLPGHFTDWDEIKQNLNLNPSTPYNGLGELTALGLAYLIPYCAVVGATCSMFHRMVVNLGGKRALAGSTLGLGLVFFMSLELLQYNLRSGTRELWYLGAVAALLCWWPKSVRRVR